VTKETHADRKTDRQTDRQTDMNENKGQLYSNNTDTISIH